MSSAYSMNARKCVHAQKPYPSQAVANESSKVGRRGKKEEERQKRQEARGGGLMEKKADQQNKNTSKELKQGVHAQFLLTKLEEELLTCPSHRISPPAPIWVNPTQAQYHKQYINSYTILYT